jgi:hypothetical protein
VAGYKGFVLVFTHFFGAFYSIAIDWRKAKKQYVFDNCSVCIARKNLNADCGEEIHAEKPRANIDMMTENKNYRVIIGFDIKVLKS